MQPICYRINDFSKAFGIGRTKIYDLLKSGQLKSVKIGGRTLIPATEAIRLINGGQS